MIYSKRLQVQPSRRQKKRPVKSKKKLCHFGVVSYKITKTASATTKPYTIRNCNHDHAKGQAVTSFL